MFGMGTGVTSSLWPPGKSGSFISISDRECHAKTDRRLSYGQASRVISTGRLNVSPRLHLQPINLVVYQDPSAPEGEGNLIFGRASRLDAFSAYPTGVHYPAVLLAEQLVHKSSVYPGPLVLGMEPIKFPAPATDRDRTVSRRSEPSSRTALIGEQPNPWDLLQPQDAMSRHRGAKPCRRCELLGRISLLSPEYLLSFERRPFHTEPPDH